MLIRHLALTASDPARSAEFYLSVIELDGVARDQPWGIRLDLADGFMLALIQGEPLPPDVAGTVHFGCTLGRPEDARAMRERLHAAGVVEVEWDDEAKYTGVKVADPDGYVVELSYDAE